MRSFSKSFRFFKRRRDNSLADLRSVSSLIAWSMSLCSVTSWWSVVSISLRSAVIYYSPSIKSDGLPHPFEILEWQFGAPQGCLNALKGHPCQIPGPFGVLIHLGRGIDLTAQDRVVEMKNATPDPESEVWLNDVRQLWAYATE